MEGQESHASGPHEHQPSRQKHEQRLWGERMSYALTDHKHLAWLECVPWGGVRDKGL